MMYQQSKGDFFMYQVVKRDGKVVEFTISKISAAITKAFEALQKQYHPSIIELLALHVTSDFESKIKDGKIAVEDILLQRASEAAFDMDLEMSSIRDEIVKGTI